MCEYEGYLPEECIGNEFAIDLKDYELVWESEKESIEVKETVGSLKFKVYGKKGNNLGGE